MALSPKSTLKICAIYAAASAAWIIASDVATHATWAEAFASMGKGLAFVVVSTALLWWLLRRIGHGDDERFLDFLHEHPTPALVIDAQAGGRIVDANPAASVFYGWRVAELRTMRISDINVLPPGEVAKRMREAAELQLDTFHFQHRLADGSLRDVAVHSGPITIDGRTLLYSIITDESEHLQLQASLEEQRDHFAALSDVKSTLLRERDPETILEALCRIVVERTGARFAWVGRVDGSTARVIPFARFGDDAGYIDAAAITLAPNDPRSRGPSGEAVRQKTAVVINDFLADPDAAPWHPLAADRGVLASGAFPLLLDQQVSAVVAVYADRRNFFTPVIVSLLAQMTDDVSAGMKALRQQDELREAEAAQRKADQRWRDAMDAAGHGVWDWDATTNRVFYSTRWKSMLGYEDGEIGDSLDEWKSRVHPEDLPRVLGIIDAHVRDATPAYVAEHRLRDRDGEYRWILDSGRVVERDALGSPIRLVGTHTDITRWHRMQSLLDQHSSVVQALTEQSIAGIAALHESRTRLVNETLARWLDRPTAEFADIDLAELVVPEDRARAAHLFAGRRAGTERLRFHRPGHEPAVMDVHASPAMLHDGASVVAVFVDAGEKERIEQERSNYLARIERMVLDSVDAMSQLVELRDPYTAGHERRVGEIAALIAAEMGHDHEYQRSLRICGAVHDIGKISVPSEILTKPGRLTPQEYALVKQHCEAGHAVLSRIASPWPLADVALQHHERWDGSGYPQGLAGETILPEARIIAVADVIESMASHRPYRPSRGIVPALAEIERGRGTVYDPAVCDAALALFRDRATALPE